MSVFADLDNSIKATYRLLKEVIPKLHNESSLKGSSASTVSTVSNQNATINSS